jgi:hypothetical protein
LKYRYYTVDDYGTLSKWWIDWDWAVLPPALLPKIGIIVSNGGEDVAAAFLYKTDSCVCWAENFISSRTSKRENRQGAIEFLVKVLSEVAKENGFSIMMSSIQHEGLIKKLLNCGYNPQYETNMSNLVKVL